MEEGSLFPTLNWVNVWRCLCRRLTYMSSIKLFFFIGERFVISLTNVGGCSGH